MQSSETAVAATSAPPASSHEKPSRRPSGADSTARHGASAERETPDPREAYAPFGRGSDAPYRGQLEGAS